MMIMLELRAHSRFSEMDILVLQTHGLPFNILLS